MGHSMCSISELKAFPNKVFARADSDGGVYVLRRSDPVAVVVSVNEYESLLATKRQLAHTKDGDA